MAYSSANMFALLGEGDEDFQHDAKAASADVKKTAAAPKAAQATKPAIKNEAPARTGSAQKGGKGQGGKGGKGGKGGYDRAPRDDDENDSGFAGGKGRKGGDRGDRGGRGGGKGGAARSGYRGGEGEEGRPRKREFDRRSGSGKGAEVKRGGTGKANWGSENDDVTNATKGEADGEATEAAEPELDPEAEAAAAEAAAEKEREEKEMTLEEYQKVLKEKKEALTAAFNKENSSDRQVSEDDFAKMGKVVKAEETDYFSGPAKERKGKAKKASDANDAEPVLTGFKVASKDDAPRDSGKRSGGKGKDRPRREGTGKGGPAAFGGKGGRGYSAPNIGDASAFPTLGA